MIYVVLLRGVNAGGNRRVPQAEFRQVLEVVGCRDVTIYINSGNAIFACEREITAAEIQSALERHFKFTIPTLLIPGQQICEIADAIPTGWTNDAPQPDKSGQKSDVIYLFDEVNTPDILENLRYKPEFETMVYVNGAVLATISRRNQSKGSLQKIIGTKLYSSVTIRNITTAKKLVELVRSR